MRLRFVFHIFIVLLLTVSAVSALHFYYLRNERLRLIDRELESAASALLSSDISRIPLDDLEAAENFVHVLLGTQKIGKLIVIRNEYGDVVYANKNADLLPDEIPDKAEWQSVNVQGQEIRTFGVAIPDLHETLQVGVFLDKELLYWRQLDRNFVLYSLAIALLLLVVSYVLATWLLLPLKSLALYLDYLTQQFEGKSEGAFQEPRAALPKTRTPDEFSRLIDSVTRLTEKIRSNLRTFQNWTALMAHEIRTPLTVIRNLVETSPKIPKQTEVLEEVSRLDRLVGGFLEWSSIEQTPDSITGIYAVEFTPIVKGVVDRYAKLYPDRLDLEVDASPTVFIVPEHGEQVISNLVSNALKYSPQSKQVKARLSLKSFSIQDLGMGIPGSVLERLGQPFNFHKQEGQKGSGLGLAWVNAICKKYGWKLDVHSTPEGTRLDVVFSP